MTVHKDPRDKTTWRYRCTVTLPDGSKRRISGTAPASLNTREATIAAEKAHVARTLNPPPPVVPTLDEWYRGNATDDAEFNGRFWIEWVIGRRNKPTEKATKRSIYAQHIGPNLGHLPLDKIDVGEIARFRSSLVAKGLGSKRINNILCVLSTPLRYADDCDVIAKAKKVGLLKVQRPEITAWSYEEYARLLAAAKATSLEWYAAVCLAGEAGLRIGEVKALRWREDVDMIAGTITVNQQVSGGHITSPKGGTSRKIPMTATVLEALRQLPTVREGFILRGNGVKGTKTDGEVDKEIQRICRVAGLPVHYWHRLRHTFATHAAMFGVIVFDLQAWLGHTNVLQTQRYVHVARNHRRDTPLVIREAGAGEVEIEARVIKMLGARAHVVHGPIGIVPVRRKSPSPSPANQQAANKPSRSTRLVSEVSESADVPLYLVGSEGGDRTPDPAVNSRLLYH